MVTLPEQAGWLLAARTLLREADRRQEAVAERLALWVENMLDSPEVLRDCNPIDRAWWAALSYGAGRNGRWIVFARAYPPRCLIGPEGALRHAVDHLAFGDQQGRRSVISLLGDQTNRVGYQAVLSLTDDPVNVTRSLALIDQAMLDHAALNTPSLIGVLAALRQAVMLRFRPLGLQAEQAVGHAPGLSENSRKATRHSHHA